MKFPWDRKYLKICFHVIVTLVITYAIINIIDGATFLITDLGTVLGSLFSGFGNIIRLFSPLIIAFLIAYLFDPIVDFYQNHYENFKVNVAQPWLANNTNLSRYTKKHNKKSTRFKTRFAGALLTYISIFFGIFIIIRLLIRSLTAGDDGVMSIINNLVDTFTAFTYNIQTLLDEWEILEFVADYVEYLLAWLNESILGFISTAVTTAVATGVWVLNFFISLVVAFYFMNHKERLIHQISYLFNVFIPKKIGHILSIFLSDLHHVFSGYIRGLILDGIILGTLIAIALSIIGIEMAIPIGILTAIFNLIPYFGGIMAFGLSVGFELILGNPTNALYAAIAIIVIQQIDSIFIVPKVVGQNVKLSAPVILLSLTIAGSLFGIIGMLLIIPTMAIIKIFAMRFVERYTKYKNEQKVIKNKNES